MEEEITLEHPVVRQAAREYLQEEAQLRSEIAEKVRSGEIAPGRTTPEDWFEIRKTPFLRIKQKLVELGFIKQELKEIGLTGTLSRGWENRWFKGKMSTEEFANLCWSADRKSILWDRIARRHQRDFGLPVVGYVPSERLIKGREALARFHEGHAKLGAKGWYPEIYEDQDALLEQLKRDILEAGFSSPEEFHEVNGELP